MATISEALAIAMQHHQAGRLAMAEEIYRRVLAVEPNQPDALHLLGVVSGQLGNHQTAIECISRALAIRPDSAEAHCNLGCAFQGQGKLDEAVACYRRALELKPGYAEGHYNLGNVRKDQGKVEEAIACYRQALKHKPELTGVHSSLAYARQYCSGEDAQAIHEEHRRWNARHAEPLASFFVPHANDRTADRRLRVGYVSPNFWGHVVGLNLLPLLREHDHRQFHVTCYADTIRSDYVTEQIRGCADTWRDIASFSDEQLAQLTRQDQIDILVDLAMHLDHNRLLAFARKPAPVQVCWAAYPGTTGLTAIDYRLTDPYLDPPGQNDQFYAEQSIRLPDTFWCYSPLGDEPEVNALPALANKTVTFGCLNNFCKVNAAVLGLWAQVLKAVEGSRLMLMTAEGAHRGETLDFLQQQGVTPDRVQFVTRQPRQQYLELYRQIDLGLDTFPYNGHSTSLDASWMGVPVVTLVGTTVVGRAGLSQLMNLGLPELVAETPSEFVRIAVALAGDLPRLGALRAGLRERMLKSPLMDAPRFARSVEAAYRSMWQRWCAGESPKAKASGG